MTLTNAYFRDITFSDDLDYLRKFRLNQLGKNSKSSVPNSGVGVGDEVELTDSTTPTATLTGAFVVGTAKVDFSDVG